MSPTLTTKQARGVAIAKCIELAAYYFNTTVADVMSSTCKKNAPPHLARQMIYLHLYRSGMGYLAIGKLFGRKSEDPIRRGVKRAMMVLEDKHQALLRGFPKIPSTLEIVTTGVPPVMESTNP